MVQYWSFILFTNNLQLPYFGLCCYSTVVVFSVQGQALLSLRIDWGILWGSRSARADRCSAATNGQTPCQSSL